MEPKSYEAGLAGGEFVGSKHAQCSRVFARTDVGHVCAASRERMVETVEYLQAGVKDGGLVPLPVANKNITTPNLVMG